MFTHSLTLVLALVPQQLLEARPAGSTWRSCRELGASWSLAGRSREARSLSGRGSTPARRRTGWRSIRLSSPVEALLLCGARLHAGLGFSA